MRKPVVILSPNSRSEEDVEGGNLLSPLYFQALLNPLAVLVDHGIDDVDEGLVAVEETVSARQDVAFEPTL
jgi:hypothetical protein